MTKTRIIADVMEEVLAPLKAIGQLSAIYESERRRLLELNKRYRRVEQHYGAAFAQLRQLEKNVSSPQVPKS